MNDNEIKIWNGVKEAAKSLNMDSSAIYKVCRGKQFATKNFKWKFAE